MSAAICTDERTKTIDGQYTLFADGASGGVIVYTVPDSDKDLPKLLPEPSSPEDLYNKHQGLIKNTIYRLSEMCRGFDYDDLEQEGRIALWTAAVQFDPYFGVQFPSYAITILRRGIMHFVKNPASRLFGGGRLDVVSVQEIQERVDEPGSSVELFAAPEELMPSRISESSEIFDVLTKAADEISLVKESKGVKALIMQLQGMDSKTITERLGITPKSYSALVTAGRKALKNNPKLLGYVSMIKNQPTESVPACILGNGYTVKFSDAATFDTTKYTIGEHLAIFSELLSGDDVAECLMDNVRLGENAVIVDEDTWTTTRFAFDMEEIQLLEVTNIRSKSTLIARKADPDRVTVTLPAFGEKYTLKLSDELRYKYTGHSPYAHLSWLAGTLGEEAVAGSLLEMTSLGSEAFIIDEDRQTVTRLAYGADSLQLLSVEILQRENPAMQSA